MGVEPIKSPGPALRAAVALVVGIALVYGLGVITTVLLVSWIQDTGGILEEQLLRKGPHRLFGRVALVWLLVFLPFFLRTLGWRGWKDTGYAVEGEGWSWQHCRGSVARGLVIGLTSIGLAIGVMLLCGRRVLDPSATLMGVIGHALEFSLSCMVVALLEETITRGILFRSLARLWNPWPTAIVISALFAFAHFLRPTPEAFDSGPVFSMSWSVLISMGDSFRNTAHIGVRTLNITLMSVVLCMFVARTGTIWMAVGTHAAWVWLKKMNGYLSDSTTELPSWSWLIGHKTDSTDSLLSTVILMVLLILALIPASRKSSSQSSHFGDV